MTQRSIISGRPSSALLTWRRGTLVTTAGIVAVLAALTPGAARAATLAAPTALSTSPGGACSATPVTVGNDDITFDVGLPSSLGSGASASIDVWDTATSATLVQETESGAAGYNVPFVVQASAFENAAGGAITEFSWDATVSDSTGTSPASVTCSLYFDPTYPGAPVITQTASTYTMGTPATFTLSPATSGGTTTAYSYQLNAGQATGTVSAGADGSASITVTPQSGPNTLTVSALSPGGNPGTATTVFFDAALPATAPDGDTNGDGIPDLVTVGGTAGVPSGLWVADGTGNGEITTPAVNIGTAGNGFSGDGSASDFNGAQAVTGHFLHGQGEQDYLVYYPSTGNGVVLEGDDHGGLLAPGKSGTNAVVSSDTWTSTDPNGDIPLQVVNGYNADPNDNPSMPDLLTVSGDSTHGYYLEYYQNFGAPGLWGSSVVLTTPTPDGTMDWNNWQIATAQDASGNVDLFLYNAGNSDLYLWRDFTVNDTNDTASYTAYHISSKWRPGPISTLRAADINRDGTPGLWTVSAEGRVLGWLVSGLGSNPAITAGHSQPLLGG